MPHLHGESRYDVERQAAAVDVDKLRLRKCADSADARKQRAELAHVLDERASVDVAKARHTVAGKPRVKSFIRSTVCWLCVMLFM